jgi:hypothetical protein
MSERDRLICGEHVDDRTLSATSSERIARG